MKRLIVLALLLGITVAQAETKIANNTCQVMLDAKFAQDGANVVLLEIAKRKLQKLKYEVVGDDATEALALKIELAPNLGKVFGSCTVTTTLRGSVDEEQAGLVLINSAKKSGLVSNVGSHCVKALKKSLEDLPKCNKLTAAPVEPVDPVDPVDPPVQPE